MANQEATIKNPLVEAAKRVLNKPAPSKVKGVSYRALPTNLGQCGAKECGHMGHKGFKPRGQK